MIYNGSIVTARQLKFVIRPSVIVAQVCGAKGRSRCSTHNDETVRTGCCIKDMKHY